MTTTNEIRTAFLDYFGKNGHEIVSSSPLVPHNDPTLLFTNAGMVQFKNVFTGLETREYATATTSQKCVRAGGKHNDLENVGYTARHHTFFEMLGNFSFGDYFKERAIELAWNLITDDFAIDKSRLLVTVYHEDDDAFDLWKKIAGLPDDRIIRIATSDNFWAMGETGPCGPCSEIFYDHGDHIPGGPPGSADEDGDRFIEIWNLVFMQYEQITLDSRQNLPKPSIDTGMGLERISALMQGSHDNYNTDTFRALIVASAEAAKVDPYGPQNVSNRVIADHLRASSFLIADGVLPSNEGRGYVLRRIMRRGMRHAHMMGCQDPLLFKLVPALIRQMGIAYPELTRAEALITETLQLEEARFKQTLDRGLKLLTEETDRLGDKEALPGEIAFRLYDTFGFPLDLTQDVLRAQGRPVDTDGFDVAMQKQREDARKAWAGSGEAADESVWFDIRENTGATEFLGYNNEFSEGQILAIVKDGARVEAANAGDEIAVIVNQTPFYAESGGQMGDVGTLLGDGEAVLAVTDTQKKVGDLHVHIGTLSGGSMTVEDVVEMRVEPDRRAGLRGHHSATHLLHAALRERLGDHVTQKGSLVAPDRLRFDISHPKAINADDMAEVTNNVNRQIRGNSEVVTRLMSPDEAIETGAMALFGEKYGDEVRVVTMGNQDNAPYSVELCGGTHVGRTGDIGPFRIISESAVAAGVRRIEAVTGQAALTQMAETEAQMQEVASLLNVSSGQVAERITALLEERKKLESDLSETRRKLATGGGNAGAGDAGVKDVAGVSFAGRVLEGIPARDLKSFADDLKKQIGSGVVAICGTDDGKASLVVGVTEDMTEKFDAVSLVRIGSAVLGGKGGGGRPDMAQAGGPDAENAPKALEAIEKVIAAT
ncbi:MAG: alanine--tRNA ligase [Alphaproteobacteria bacterium]|nr:alanine--tRNA ligase [Alphaproteobacteria bacterium]